MQKNKTMPRQNLKGKDSPKTYVLKGMNKGMGLVDETLTVTQTTSGKMKFFIFGAMTGIGLTILGGYFYNQKIKK